MILQSNPNLIIGNKVDTKNFCLNFIKKTYNINFSLNQLEDLKIMNFIHCFSSGNLYKKQDLDKLNQIFSLDYNDIPTIVLIEDAHLLPVNIIQNYLKIFENIPLGTYILLTTNSIGSILESIKSRCSIIFLESNNTTQKYKKTIIELIELSKCFNFNYIENFIDNNFYTEFEIKELCEEIFIYLLSINELKKANEIKNILKNNILPTMQKNILRMIFMILTK